VQKEEFKRLGVLTDWEDIYLTMDPKIEAKETEVLARFTEEGYIYRGYMPLPWSRESQSALAMAEIEYYEKESPSLWFLARSFENDYYILVWTTTPWTLFGLPPRRWPNGGIFCGGLGQDKGDPRMGGGGGRQKEGNGV